VCFVYSETIRWKKKKKFKSNLSWKI